MAGPIGVIGGGLTQVIESGPDKFSYAVGQIFVLYEIIFGKIGPPAVFHIVRGGLVVGVFGHGPSHYREFVDSPRTDGRCRFASQNDFLGEFFVIFDIFERAVIESRYVHDCRHVVVDYGVRGIHALRDGTSGVFAVADVL